MNADQIREIIREELAAFFASAVTTAPVKENYAPDSFLVRRQESLDDLQRRRARKAAKYA